MNINYKELALLFGNEDNANKFVNTIKSKMEMAYKEKVEPKVKELIASIEKLDIKIKELKANLERCNVHLQAQKVANICSEVENHKAMLRGLQVENESLKEQLSIEEIFLNRKTN